MQKPFGMSRRDYLNMKAIIRDYLNANVHVWFSGNTAGGSHVERHEEGFDRTQVDVLLNKDGTYSVYVTYDGRDCDGRHSSNNERVVAYRRKVKRFYLFKDWKNNRKGKFNIKTHWRVVSEGRSSQRDYRAEEAGY